MGLFNKNIKFMLSWLKASSYRSDIAWLASGTLVAQIITFAMIPVLSRLYTPTEFAIQALFAQLSNLLSVFVTYRYEYLIQLMSTDAEAWRLIRIITYCSTTLVILITPIFWGLQESISLSAGSVDLGPWVAWIPIAALASSISVALQGYIQRLNKYKLSAGAEITSRALSASTPLFSYFWFSGPGGLVLAGLSGSLGKIIWIMHGLVWTSIEKTTSNFKLIKSLWRLSGSLVISHGLLAFSTAIPMAFIAKSYGSDILGQYVMANLIVTLPSTLIGSAIGSVYYQRASELWINKKNFKTLWQATSKKLLIIGLPAYFGAFLLLPWLIPIILGDKWSQAGQFCILLSISGFFSFITSPLDRACLIIGASWYILLHHVIRLMTTLLGVWSASVLNLGVEQFLSLMVGLMSMIYLLDYWVQWTFSSKTPSLNVNEEFKI